MNDLSNSIIKYLGNHPSKLAREIANDLDIPRKEVNHILYSTKGFVQDKEFRWSLSTVSPSEEDVMKHSNAEADDSLKEIELSDDEAQGVKKSNFLYTSLESVRTRLLDLSGRNALLNFKHPKSSCLRVIDELPDQIYDVLQDGKKFAFVPVPEPTEQELIGAGYIKYDPITKQKIPFEYPIAEEWAKRLGFNTQYDLPLDRKSTRESKHSDTNLQTLLYPTDLESRLRLIRSNAESAIEESGTNILYLALGFLEWYESKESEVQRLSPLFTIPVQLEKSDLDRRSEVYRYTITIKDDGLITNVTLKEKLASDFGLILPTIDEEVSPEAYFELIESSVLKHQPKWRIRRQASLVLLNFSKQAMYKDLDPKNWPTIASIQNHPIIEKFFSSQLNVEDDRSFSYEEEHVLDQIDNIHNQYPLIYDADSSQHSAIVDVVNGKSLVIEGPPGSGKSQTITNLIAACIANGQSVLFVAEKMAALNVVKNRLDKADLGDFCLELHSHKTNKQKILSDLIVRLSKQEQFTQPSNIDDQIVRYEHHKAKLNEYALKINSLWLNTGLTIHQIFQKATRLRQKYALNPENLHIDGLNGENLTPLRRSELRDNALMLNSIFKQVSEQAKDGHIQNHLWYGLEKINLSAVQIAEILSTLRVWTDSIVTIEEQWLKSLDILGLNRDESISINKVNIYVDIGKKLPELVSGEVLSKLDLIFDKSVSFSLWVDKYKDLHNQLINLQHEIYDDAILSASTHSMVLDSNRRLKSHGLDLNFTIDDLSNHQKKLDEINDQITEIENKLVVIRQNSPLDLQVIFNNSIESLLELNLFLSLIQKLPTELWRYRDEIFDNNELDNLIPQLAQKLKVLAPIHQKINDLIRLEALPSSAELRSHQSTLENSGFFKWLSSDWRASRKSILNLSKIAKPNKSLLLSLLPELVTYKDELEAANRINTEYPLLGNQYQGAETPIDRISKLRSWYKAIRDEYGAGFGERVKIGNALIAMNKEFAMALADEASKGFKDKISKVIQNSEEIASNYPAHPLNTDEKLSLVINSPVLELKTKIDSLLNNFSKIFKNRETKLIKAEELSHKLKYIQEEQLKWQEEEFVEELKPFEQSLSIRPNHFSQSHLGALENSLRIAMIVNECTHIKQSLKSNPTEYQYQQIINDVARVKLHLDDERVKRRNFISSGDINLSKWLINAGENNHVLRNHNALNNPLWLNTWSDYINLRNRLYKEGFSNFIHSLEESQLKNDNLEDILDLVIYHQLCQEIFSNNVDLANFTGLEQNALQQRFKEYDANILRLQRKKIAFRASRKKPPIGVSFGKVGDYSEISLIKHEATKSKKHIALRALLKRSGQSIQTIKPCFMMSPMSVAQYLEPGRFHFDLVVMDEASQIRPEDALGAIARGSRLVVVGDPKQLPPTNFFNKVFDDDMDEEIVGLQDSESILEAVMPMFSNRRLRWHYRSKHESLIAFSNKHFYDSDLVLFPSPFKASSEFGVKRHFVNRGRFTSGKNIEEVNELIKSVAYHLINNTHESIGIVAMNALQRDEIEKQLDQYAKDNPILLDAYEKNKQKDEPLFIKNLENVQGDERDVIYISMTYGPEQIGGKTMQRFGPINTSEGWRRLNVLFTRSKKRMHIFTSMNSFDILAESKSSKGVQALKSFLEYAENGHLHQTKVTGKSADSDFEISVMKVLEDNGYKCEAQLGVAGFFLDLAVHDPGKEGKFLMGIECDGATYHSAKSARDRDHLRQVILEDLGWKIRRIWSTDWFKHPEAQIQPILNELEKLKTPILIKEFDDSGYPTLDLSTSLDSKIENVDDTEDKQQLDNIDTKETISIRDRLIKFDRDIIRKELPETDEGRRLLRSEMLEILLEYLPTSKADFQEIVPPYIRVATSTNEAKYLEAVLSIIADYA